MKIKLYHGSEKIINPPIFGTGKKNNDYGQGFYCTENIKLAGEWACQNNNNGFINSYFLETDELKILNLQNGKYNILNWLAILVANRTSDFNPVTNVGKKFLLENYLIDTAEYDVIKGWRADDSYFTFTRNFLQNSISIQTLSKAMKLGNLGSQTVLISKKSFENISFMEAKEASKNIYFNSFIERDINARSTFNTLREQINPSDIYFINIMTDKNIQNKINKEFIMKENFERKSNSYEIGR